MDPIFTQQFDFTQPKKKSPGGMFAEGGVGRAIAGMIGDYLLQRAGMQPVYQPSMLEKQKLAQQEAQYQHHRSDEFADFQKKRQFEIDNPMPGQPGEFEDALTQSGVQPGTPEWVKAMTTRRENM